MHPAIFALPLALLAAAHASAQCQRQASLAPAFRAAQPIFAGQQQNPNSGWTFERSGPGNNQRLLLEGVTSPSWLSGAWGSPHEPFLVPLAGPIYSPVPADNQVLFFQRAPSFEGILLHPGNGADAARAVFKPQAQVDLTSLTLHVEDLGSSSGGGAISARIERSNNTILPLIPLTPVPSLVPALTLSTPPGLPITLDPGDRLVIETTAGANGNAAEDWLNVNAQLSLTGPPVIEVQPLVSANCGGPALARIRANGATAYRWYRDNVALNDGPTGNGSTIAGAATATLSIDAFAPGDVGVYTCVVSGPCSPAVTSTGATITLCFADFNCDGFLDFFDYDAFVEAFETGDALADYNRDGFLDFFDYDDFVQAFETGC